MAFAVDPKLRVEAGIHLMGIAGDVEKKIREVAPIVRIEYQATDWLHLIGGTLRGNLNHQLYEPMYDNERYLYAHQENGLQLLTHTKFWNSDMWCNWEQFIVTDSPYQERFTFGWRNDFLVNTPKLTLQFPLHLMANHRGGQIDAVQDTCIETLVNGAVGVELRTNFANTIVDLSMPLLGFLNNSNENHIHTHFKDGWGFYPTLSVERLFKTNHILVNLGYWYGNRFVSGRGSWLYQSISRFDDTFEMARRNMLTAKAYFVHRYRWFSLGIDAQAYYDMDYQKTDFAIGIYMRYDEPFRLSGKRK